RVKDVQTALLLKHKDRHCRELLGDGADAEPGRGTVGGQEPTISQAEPTLEEHPAVARNQDRPLEEVVTGKSLQGARLLFRRRRRGRGCGGAACCGCGGKQHEPEDAHRSSLIVTAGTRHFATWL